MQFKPSLLQLQESVLQGFTLLHPHLIKRITVSGASSTFVGRRTGCYDFSLESFTHPYFSTSSSGRLLSSSERHTIAWRWALFTFSSNASLEGGREQSFVGTVEVRPVFHAYTLQRVSDIDSLVEY